MPSRLPTRAEARSVIIGELWRRGRATDYLLDEGQREWVRRFREGDGHTAWMIGRQRGKSYAALALACEESLRTPGTIVRYAALTGKSALAIVAPTLAQVLKDCPPDLMPDIREDRGTVAFRNGSVLSWAGTDAEQFERLRGPRAHLVLLDESAFYSDLEAVESALLPQLTTTQGKALYLSTPPESPAHSFVNRYRAACAAGRGVHATVHDNPRLGLEGVRQLIRREAERLGMTEAELVASTYWRREYLAEIVTEESRAAVPGWTIAVAEALTREVQRPEHFDGYVGLDFGFGDPSVALFGYWDFVEGRVVIEDEAVCRGGTTEDLSKATKAKELELWGTNRFEGTLLGAAQFDGLPEWMQHLAASAKDAPRQPYLRVGDNDPQLLADLLRLHSLAVLPSKKDDKALAVNDLDLLVRQGKFIVHPRCTTLRRELATVLWNRRRTEWERTPLGHGDAIDAACYLVRNVRRHRDPRPPAPVDPWLKEMQRINDGPKRTALARAFGVRR